ncbi:uncharacterized protein TRIADDRAFT_51874 [Trichoplax adhaerens]|uniref:G-protein coupled receptors family 1 profile domain-containing protein n=1 Tax=Trichoplax adhaerens TaxID=10228 RepID=B3RL46_TRIAD|nr:hypothetical protein TRIADDRAFT_51874 [Trichoplax adhaerens]EDV28697.1 hypothetical protein TRIADDRAFT_51874 [Trichoplax adhaerens]|eukprot:XP_002107899.1 hypothetical protein TRIADDRAFT_51874 [Trichoplax adhaerens]
MDTPIVIGRPQQNVTVDYHLQHNFTSTVETVINDCADMWYSIIFLVTLFLTFLFNSICLFIIWNINGFKNNKNHLYVRALLVCDVGAALFMAVCPSMYLIDCSFVKSQGLCSAIGFITSVFNGMTALIVALMCIDRYLAIIKPFLYRRIVTYNKIVICIILCAVWLSLHMAIPLWGSGKFITYPIGRYCSFDIFEKKPYDRVLSYLVFGEGIIISFLVIFCSIRIIRSLRKQRKSIKTMSIKQTSRAKARLITGNFEMLTAWIAVCFISCYLPFVLFRLLCMINIELQDTFGHYITENILYLNPLLNPFLCVTYNKRYRTKFHIMLMQCGLVCCISKVRRKLETAIQVDRVEMALPSAFDERKSTVVSANDTSCMDFESRFQVNTMRKSSTILSMVDLHNVHLDRESNLIKLQKLRANSKLSRTLQNHILSHEQNDSGHENIPASRTSPTNSITDNVSVAFMIDNTDNTAENTDHSDDTGIYINDNINDINDDKINYNDFNKTDNTNKAEITIAVDRSDKVSNSNFKIVDTNDVANNVKDTGEDGNSNSNTNLDATDTYYASF